MKLKYEMTTMEMNGEYVAVPIGSDVNFCGIIRMNDTTSAILELLKNDITEDEIIDKLFERYDADKEIIGKSVKKVISVLKEENLLV